MGDRRYQSYRHRYSEAVLNAPREMLIEKTDLEEETVDEVIRILKSEFEEEEPEQEPEQGQE